MPTTSRARAYFAALLSALVFGGLLLGPAAAADTLEPGGGIYTVTAGPAAVAFSPDGAHAYVANHGGSVGVIDTGTNALTDIISTAGAYELAVTADGSEVYALHQLPPSISIIDTSTNTVVDSITGLGGTPVDLDFSPDGTHLYVVDYGSASVLVVNTATGSVTDTVTVDTYPSSGAFSPDGSRFYVTNSFSDTVSVIDTSTKTVVATIATSDFPYRVAVTPDGTRVYVADYQSGVVDVIDAATNTVVDTITVGSGGFPLSLAITPDGSRVYVTNYDGAVTIIDSGTNTIGDAVSVGWRLADIAISPDGESAYLVQSDHNHVQLLHLLSVPAITTATLPGGTEDEPYVPTTIAATGYPAPTFAVTDGTFPPGLDFATDGTIDGTPTAAGTYRFTVTATSAGGTDTADYTVIIAAAASPGDGGTPESPGLAATGSDIAAPGVALAFLLAALGIALLRLSRTRRAR